MVANRLRQHLSQHSQLTAQIVEKHQSPAIAKCRGGNASIDKLVAFYPADIRRQVKRNFIELYASYRVLENRVGSPINDLAGAQNVYIGSNYLAYTNLALPRSDRVVYFYSLHSQTRKVQKASRGF